MSKEEKIVMLAEYYGFKSRCQQCVEEMSELTKEICKYFRDDNVSDKETVLVDLQREIADVEIVISELKHLTDREFIEQEIMRKLDRQIDRALTGAQRKEGLSREDTQ